MRYLQSFGVTLAVVVGLVAVLAVLVFGIAYHPRILAGGLASAGFAALWSAIHTARNGILTSRRKGK